MKILLIFPNQVERNIRDIEAGKAPRERLYGFYELLNRPGFTFVNADSRFKGFSNRIVSLFRSRGINLVDIKTLFKIYRSDVVVVKDNVSFMVSLTAALFGKPVVYYDSLFPIPKMRIKRFFLKRCLSMCSQIVGYNNQQVADYEHALGLELAHKYTHLDFLLDEQFYNRVYSDAPEPTSGGYILSIGRDVGRDFYTLIEAAREIKCEVKIVTLPYLLKNIDLPANVEILQDISYEALFTLYKGAKGVAVPLKKGLSYASGIRAIMESLVLKKPSIVSSTPFVENNCSDYPNIIVVEPEDVAAMKNAIQTVLADEVDNQDFSSTLPAYSTIPQAIENMLIRLTDAK
ncbi:glycosyltransferase [Salinimonas chungwhensis]|uniref:glycosyltransferase n=1 Tax=Salinimonas chungwhensis TaxID=265425 RepID=UPI000365CE3B|nr:glycosyltransferase [Salinimonas chungwhensis]